jgi:tetratricopeptide (TPR) repeat protein
MINDLNTALGYHQRGMLEQAAQFYQTLLAQNANHADALHLLGVVALQRGDPARAVEYISRAAALNSGVAAYHANLAEAYRGLRLHERAIECCRVALALRPHFPEVANNLGLTWLDLGKTDEAIAQFREAIRLKPDFAMAHNNLGNALRLHGDKAQAIDEFRRSLQCDPNLVEAHSNLGQLLLEHYRRPEALVHCREAVRLRPDFPEARNNLGNVLRELGRLAEAKACYAEALRLNDKLPITYNNIGQTLQEEGKLDEALPWYERALKQDANSARIQTNLASLLEELDRRDEAIARYELALRLEPNYAEAYSGLGWIRHEQGQYSDAMKFYRRALELRPDLATGYCNLGTLMEELSDFPEAERCLREALRLDPSHVGALAQLATLLRGKLPDVDQAAMRQLLADPNLSVAKRLGLHYGLALVLDAKGAYEQAAEHLRHANAMRLADWRKREKGEYDPADHEQFVAGMMATCTPEFFGRIGGFGLDTERPIFIVGLPRSGTTLTEQILARHSQVFGAGELALAHEAFRSLPKRMGRDARALDCLGLLDRQTTRLLAERYLDRLREQDAEAPHVADKMPDNYLYLGFLAALFPRAKFIHCRRDLRDVAVSCWMTHFRQIRWACDLDHIVSRFRAYERLMEHWRRVLPVPVLEVNYEETVADLEGVARRLVAWCGLEWEPASLSYYEGRGPVRTASVMQVRQPIYTRSVGRWNHYKQALAPFLAQLELIAPNDTVLADCGKPLSTSHFVAQV